MRCKKGTGYGVVGTTDGEIEKIAELDEREARCIKNALSIGKASDLAWAKSKHERVRTAMPSGLTTKFSGTVIS